MRVDDIVYTTWTNKKQNAKTEILVGNRVQSAQNTTTTTTTTTTITKNFHLPYPAPRNTTFITHPHHPHPISSKSSNHTHIIPPSHIPPHHKKKPTISTANASAKKARRKGQ
jgi:hypothetical protein